MHNHRRLCNAIVWPMLLLAPLALFGCSSGPDQLQLKNLQELKDEASAMNKDIALKQQRKSDLQREIAEKNARLKKCHDDEQVVSKKLGKS